MQRHAHSHMLPSTIQAKQGLPNYYMPHTTLSFSYLSIPSISLCRIEVVLDHHHRSSDRIGSLSRHRSCASGSSKWPGRALGFGKEQRPKCQHSSSFNSRTPGFRSGRSMTGLRAITISLSRAGGPARGSRHFEAAHEAPSTARRSHRAPAPPPSASGCHTAPRNSL